MAEQERDRRYASQLRRFLSILRDSRQVDVRDEVVGVAALEHEHLVFVVGFGSLDQGDEVANQLGAEEVDRRSEDLGEEHRPVDHHGDGLGRPGIQLHRVAHVAGAAIESSTIEAYSVALLPTTSAANA